MTRKKFDTSAWLKALEKAVAARGVSWNRVGRDTDVGASAISRMRGGRLPDAASLAALSAWAGINPTDFCPKVPVLCPHCGGTGQLPPGVLGTVEASDETRNGGRDAG